jgi:hypothetical protein
MTDHPTLTFTYREFMGTIAISPEANAWTGTISREDIVLTSQHISLDELVDSLQSAVDFYLDENQ